MEDFQLRCPARMHAMIVDGMLEVKCRDCRTDPGEVVLHYFDLRSGELVETRRWRSVHELKQFKIKERRERQLAGSA